MKNFIEENIENIITFNETQIERLKEKKNCEVCNLLIQFCDDYKIIVDLLLEKNENNKQNN